MRKNKQGNAKPIRLQKKTIITLSIILAAVLVVAGIGLGIYARHYGDQNHADKLTQDELYEYNYVLTVFGRNASVIGENEVLILDTVTKNLGGNSEASFVIYQYSKESDLLAALNMTPEEIAANSAYEYMGTGTVTLVDDSFAGMQNMKTVYLK